MIITEMKAFEDIVNYLSGEKRIFIIGCGNCATLCETGGEKQVEEMKSRLELLGKTITGTMVSESPCHIPLLRKEVSERKERMQAIEEADSILVLSCGSGVQSAVEVFPAKVIHGGLNTLFLGNLSRNGVFDERCSLCGECLLEYTGGICPITRCAKSLVNGPCGGSTGEDCEIGGGRKCAWGLIYKRMKALNKEELLLKYQIMRNFQKSTKPGFLNLRIESQEERSRHQTPINKENLELVNRGLEFGIKNKDVRKEDVLPSGISRLQAALEMNEFVITSEIVPPKGTNISRALYEAEYMRPFVTAININENPSSIMRLNSLSLSRLLLERGIEPVLHLTTREKSRLALQSELLGAAVLGIKNILIMTGDHGIMGDHKEVKPVYDLDSVQLLRLATELMGGFDYNCHPLDGVPKYFLGAVANPNHENPSLQILKLKKKSDAGARFVITQAVYSLERFRRWHESVKGFGLKIIAGLIPLKNAEMARYMNTHLPGTYIPNEIILRLEKAASPAEEGLKIAIEIARELKKLADGIHIMPIGWIESIPAIVKEL